MKKYILFVNREHFDRHGNYDLSTEFRAPEAFDDLKAAKAALDAVEIVAEAKRFGGFSAIYAEIEEADSEGLESVVANDPIYEKNFRDYPEFQECLNLLLDQPELAAALGAGGREFTLREYAPAAVQARLLEALR